MVTELIDTTYCVIKKAFYQILSGMIGKAVMAFIWIVMAGIWVQVFIQFERFLRLTLFKKRPLRISSSIDDTELRIVTRNQLPLVN